MNFKITLSGWAIIAIVLGVVILHILICKPHTQTVEIHTCDTVQQYVYKPYNVYKDTVIIHYDTVYIDSMTPIGSIPLRIHSQNYRRTLKHGKDTYTLTQTIETDYRGILYAQRMISENDTFDLTLKQKQGIKPFLYGAISFNAQKSIQSELVGGVHLGEHLFIYGGATVSDRLDADARVGVGWRL